MSGGGRGGGITQTADPFVPEPSISEVEVAMGKLKRCNSPGGVQIPSELIQAGVGEVHCKLRSTNVLS
jgi:hypothetical protein